MTHTTSIAFESTREMFAWIDATDIAGACSVVDNWTYGRCEVNPVPRSYGYGGEVRHFIAKDWRTVAQA